MVLLDVLIPTRNRARLLARALDSVLSAPVPAGLSVKVIVIDNGSTDGTAALLEWMAARHRGRIAVVKERRCGKSRALNAGIEASAADLIGMIDDDEEIDRGWYEEVLRAFTSDPTLDYIGGPYRPVWGQQPPDWIPSDYLAVLGDVGSGLKEQDFGAEFPGILKGGNAVVRRSTLLRVGRYAEYLGPAGAARLLSCEDEEMYFRLVKSGARGRYLPGLVIHHHVCGGRLTRGYFRAWCFWRGVSRGLMDRAHPMRVRYLAGVPRFLFGSAGRAFALLVSTTKLEPQRALSEELKVWDLAGFLWGRHIYTLARHSPIKSRRMLQSRLPEIVDSVGENNSEEHWNPSCYFDGRHVGPSSSDHHQTCKVCLVEHRGASTPTL